MLKLSLPITREALTLPAIISTFAIIIFFMPSTIESTLIYDRHAIEAGDFWRIITGHLAHTNLYHLLLNLAGLILLWALHGDHYKSGTYLTVFFTSACICSLGMYAFDPSMLRYVGLSGVLHGIFVWGAIKDIQKGWRSGYLLLIGVIIKIANEQVFGASVDIENLINARVAINAHLWGAVGGLTYYFITLLTKKASGS